MFQYKKYIICIYSIIYRFIFIYTFLYILVLFMLLEMYYIKIRLHFLLPRQQF